MGMSDVVRAAWVLIAVGVAAGSATSNPPPQAMPPQAMPPQGQAGAPAASPAYGPCEYACGQIARCELAPYEGCVVECRRSGTEQQPEGRERLDALSRTTCDQLAAAMREPAAPPAGQVDPPPAPPAPASGGGVPEGRWVSPPHMSYTNAAMVSADIYLEVAIAGDGGFRGSWGRYLCLTQLYGIWSCGKSPLEGAVSGRLAADGTGAIELERVGRTTLAWKPKSATELVLELPRDWQGGVLFRSTVKR
jgi:hypothetical protein